MPPYADVTDARSFSQVLEDLGKPDDARLSLGEMVDAFAERGFGAVMLVLAILNALPLPPGATTVLGAPLLLLSAQLALKQDKMWLPRWALKAFVDRKAYRTASMKVIRPIRMIENLSRPRLLILNTDISQMLVGLACLILCIILVLPIPFGNMAPAITIAIFALGLMQRDGIAIILGWLGVAFSAGLLFLASAAIVAVFDKAWAWVSHLF